MFKDYDCRHNPNNGGYIYTIIDTEFEHPISIQVGDKWTTEELRGRLFDLFVGTYEDRGLKVGVNASIMIYRLGCSKWSPTALKDIQAYSKKYTQYKEDIEKYTLLL